MTAGKIILSPKLSSAPIPAVTTTKMADARSFRTSSTTAITTTIAPRLPRLPMVVAPRRRTIIAGWCPCPNQLWIA